MMDKVKKSNVLDLIIFLLMSVMTCLFTFDFVSDPNFGSFFEKLGIPFNYRESQTPPVLFYAPILGVFLFLLILFWVRRYKATKVKPKVMVTLLAFVAIASVITSSFLFPYGSRNFTFLDPINKVNVDIYYAGFSLEGRIFQALVSCLYILYFYVTISYFKTFSDTKEGAFIISLVLYALIIIALLFNVYSYIVNFEDIKHNVLITIGKESGAFSENITSLTTHKNIYGTFLIFGFLACLQLFFKKPRIYLLLLMIYFTLTSYIINSITSLLVMAFGLVALLILYPFFNMKKHKGYSVSCVVLMILFVLSAATITILYFFVFKGKEVGDKIESIVNELVNNSSLLTRIDHWKIALSMVKDPILFPLGYGKIPFREIYKSYDTLVYPQDPVWTSHNGFIEQFMYSGAIGGGVTLIAYLAMAIMILKMFKNSYKKNFAASYLISGLGLIFYSMFEPRALFLLEGSNIFFMMIILWPLLYNYNKEDFSSENKKTLIKGLKNRG